MSGDLDGDLSFMELSTDIVGLYLIWPAQQITELILFLASSILDALDMDCLLEFVATREEKTRLFLSTCYPILSEVPAVAVSSQEGLFTIKE